MSIAVHQFIPTLAARDAIGRHTLMVQRALRSAGIASEIYAGEVHRELARAAMPYERFDGDRAEGTMLLYQCSTGSPVGSFCAQRPEPLLIDYHNITPAALFAPWEPHVAVELTAGRHQLADLALSSAYGFADSAYNQRELVELGYARTAVVPILFDAADFEGEADPIAMERLHAARRGGPEWLFVGRLSPNKAQHDLVRAFAAYHRLFDPRARLHLVGSPSSARYHAAVLGLVDDLGLGQSVEVATSVSHAELIAQYRNADAFVCLSDHEGFCVPLLEAMHHRVPIVAFASTAVPETLGGGGLLLDDKSPAVVACAVDRVTTDPALREALVAAGEGRLAEFDLRRTTEQLLAVIAHAAQLELGLDLASFPPATSAATLP